MCCLFGLYDYGNCLSVKTKEEIIRVLSKECEDRGTDATGIAYMNGDKMTIYKRPLPAHKMKFRLRGNPSVIMGHTRMTTQGSEKKNYNNHPFYSTKLNYALAHNGVLRNDISLRKSEKLPKTKIQTDSYIAVQLIDSKNTLSFDSLKYMAEKVEGSFCFTVLSGDNELYIVKGDNPMCIVHFKGFYLYASTTTILSKALDRIGVKKWKKLDRITINEGEILKIDAFGNISKNKFTFRHSYLYNYPVSSWDRDSKFISKAEDDYLQTLIYYGELAGIDENIILTLLDYGYDYMDIEELIYNPELLYGYFEDEFCTDI